MCFIVTRNQLDAQYTFKKQHFTTLSFKKPIRKQNKMFRFFTMLAAFKKVFRALRPTKF